MTGLRGKLAGMAAAKSLGDRDVHAIREWAAREHKKQAGVGRPSSKRFVT